MSLQSQLLSIHDKVYKLTGGWIGHRILGGMPSLLLSTTGRRSGTVRTTTLTYATDGDEYLLVASNGGSDRPPAWLLNLRAQPEVEIQIARRKMRATARILEPSDPDYERTWAIVNRNNADRYSAYQKKTDRRIPVVAISPS